MDATPNRRIVRRAMTALAILVLLVAGYVSSHFTVIWLMGRGTISGKNPIGTIYSPIWLYQLSDLPGSDEFLTVALWCFCNGERPFDKCRTSAIRMKSGDLHPARRSRNRR